MGGASHRLAAGFLIPQIINYPRKEVIMNPKTPKKETSKLGTVFGLLIIFGVIALVIWGAMALFGGHKTPTHKVAAVSKTITKTTAKPIATTPTVSMATLNAEAVPILTPVLADFQSQMATGQADAQLSNAGDINSAFHVWETNEGDKQNVANNKEYSNAYNKADNNYYNANQTAPAALNNWDSDAGNLPGDITQWADAEETVAQDHVTGSSSLASDQQTAATDLQNYQTDLSKAQADLEQL